MKKDLKQKSVLIFKKINKNAEKYLKYPCQFALDVNVLSEGVA